MMFTYPNGWPAITLKSGKVVEIIGATSHTYDSYSNNAPSSEEEPTQEISTTTHDIELYIRVNGQSFKYQETAQHDFIVDYEIMHQEARNSTTSRDSKTCVFSPNDFPSLERPSFAQVNAIRDKIQHLNGQQIEAAIAAYDIFSSLSLKDTLQQTFVNNQPESLALADGKPIPSIPDINRGLSAIHMISDDEQSKEMKKLFMKFISSETSQDRQQVFTLLEQKLQNSNPSRNPFAIFDITQHRSVDEQCIAQIQEWCRQHMYASELCSLYINGRHIYANVDDLIEEYQAAATAKENGEEYTLIPPAYDISVLHTLSTKQQLPFPYDPDKDVELTQVTFTDFETDESGRIKVNALSLASSNNIIEPTHQPTINHTCWVDLKHGVVSYMDTYTPARALVPPKPLDERELPPVTDSDGCRRDVSYCTIEQAVGLAPYIGHEREYKLRLHPDHNKHKDDDFLH